MMETTGGMRWLYDFFVNSGVSASVADWGVVIITVMCFGMIFWMIKVCFK